MDKITYINEIIKKVGKPYLFYLILISRFLLIIILNIININNIPANNAVP